VAPFRNVAPTGRLYQVVAMDRFEFSAEGILRRGGAGFHGDLPADGHSADLKAAVP
jgi:hypothetical protein